MSRDAIVLVLLATGGISMLGCLAYLLGMLLSCWKRIHEDMK